LRKSGRKALETNPILSIGLKGRFRLTKFLPYGQIGLEQLSGSGFYLVQLYYGIGTEIFLTDKIFLNLNIRKGVVPDFHHFLTLGININIAPFIR
jgi:hypothetical protein